MQVFKHIFTSPSSAMLDGQLKMRTKASQARINGMQSVTYGSIAYVCVLVRFFKIQNLVCYTFHAYILLQYRFCISDIPDWRIKDRVFEWHELHNEVVAILKTAEAEDPEWLKDLLEFWNA